MKKMLTLLCVLGLLGVAGPAWGATYLDFEWKATPTDDDWMVAGNWDDLDDPGGTLPGPPPFYEQVVDPTTYQGRAYITTGATVKVHTAANPNPQTGAYYLYLGISDGTKTGHMVFDSTDGTTELKTRYAYVYAGSSLTMNNGRMYNPSGTLYNYGTITINNDDGTEALNNKGTKVYDGAVVTHNSGTHKAGYYGLSIYGGGKYYLKGGRLETSSSISFSVAGLLDQTGGTVSIGRQGPYTVNIEDGGLWKISGGTVTTPGSNRGYLLIDEGGTFHIVGPDTTQIKFKSHSGSAVEIDIYAQNATGTLMCEIAQPEAGGAPGITKIELTDSRYGIPVARFLDGSILDMVISSADEALLTPNVSYFDLLTASSNDGGKVVDEGLVFATGDAAKWNMSLEDLYDDSGNEGTNGVADTLRVTYVPEPATLALLGVGLVGVLLRRRK